MFTDETLDTLSIQSLWRKSQQSTQHSVRYNNGDVCLLQFSFSVQSRSNVNQE